MPEFTDSPKIDGHLENPLWKKGAALDNFTQYEPQEGAQPSEKTIAYIGYDKKNLYIAIRCFDSNPKGIRACLTKRDSVFGDDDVTIYMLSYEYRPGTVFYFGIDDNQEEDDSGIWRREGRYYFIKFSYWWRI